MITIDLNSSTPPYEQVRSQIAAQIRSGELPGDHRLPSIRQLASDLRVAPGTIARAYSELEQAELIATDGRRGSRVRHDFSGSPQSNPVRLAVDELVLVAAEADLTEADLVGMVMSAWRGRINQQASNPGPAKRLWDTNVAVEKEKGE